MSDGMPDGAPGGNPDGIPDGTPDDFARRDHAGDLDILLSRAVSGDREALAAVRARAAAEPAVLEELAMWQADELRMARVARELESAASRVELPPPVATGERAWRLGLGWAVAAVIALAWISQSVFPRSGEPVRANVAGFDGFKGFATADDAFDAYVDKARADGVIYGDVAPPTIIGSRELGGGQGFEILVVRQIVERRRVPEMFRLVPVDESGALAPVVIRPRTEEIR
ncbi:MAG: hypothetical protein NTU45_14970 [Planctomycetota bacterium]|nr:hypothetical protein [Planctomycetota bacterium]